MVLQNYLILQTGVPTRVHFIDHSIDTRTITDNITQRPKAVNALVFDLDRVDGVAKTGKFSTLSDKLANQFASYLKDHSYTKYEFIITQRGSGFMSSYTVQAIPLSGQK
jgi:hypothetical protein